MGMPRLRQAYTPHPVVDQSAAHLRAYIEGNDAVSGRPLMQEVFEGLTSPLEDADLQGLSFERTTPRLVEPHSEDDLQRLFEENRWTDMLPIILPTEARVAAMLEGTSHRPDEIVGRLRPTVFREAVGNIHGFINLRKAIPSSQRDVDDCVAALKLMLGETGR